MAKVKTAKQKITEYLKAKGLDGAEIKDAFDELEAADTDLDKLAGQVTNLATANDKWNKWYNEAAPELQAIAAERDELKKTVDALKKAGVSVTPSVPETPKPEGNAQYVTADQLREFQMQIAKASSDTMKAITKVGIRHFNRYKEEVDLDAIEEVMGKHQGISVEDAYDRWVAPKQKELDSKEREEEINRRVKEQLQAEISKMGPVRRRKASADEDIPRVEISDKKATGPSDRELRDAFLNDLNSIVTH